MKKLHWQLFPLVLFILLALFLWRGLSLEPQHLPSVQVNKVVPSFHLPSLNATQDFTSNAMLGQVVLLNVWASWCAACIEEQVFLMQLSRQGLPIYGLNYKDTSSNAQKWLNEWGNPYRLIGLDRDGHVAIDLGVYGAPETFLIDSKGIIRYRYAGILNKAVWNREFLPRIKQLREDV